MKKFICATLVLILMLSITACRKENLSPMEISKTKFTEDEEDIIELLKFNDSANVFDFTVDKTVKTLSINSYELNENGEWKIVCGDRHAIVGKKGRIALSFNIIANGMTVSIQDESGTGSMKHTIPQTINTSDMSITTAFANNPMEIVYEKQVPIAVQIISSKDNIVSYDVEYFFKPQEYKKLGYEHVYAIAATFSQKELS